MKVLYISHKNPVLEDEGAKIVIMGTLKGLADRGCSITLLYLDHDDCGPSESLRKICSSVMPITHRRPSWYAGMLESLFRNTPYSVWMYRNQRLRQAIETALMEGDYDVVHMETALLYQYYDLVRFLPVAIRHHNLEGSLLAQQAFLEPSLFKRLVLRWQGGKLMRYEKEAVNGTDMSIAISQNDRLRIMSDYDCKKPVCVIPSGIKIERSMPHVKSEHCLVFSGRVEWGPNLDGIVWFIKEVFPLVQRRYPEIKLYVVGGRPPVKLKALETDNILVTGFVESVPEYVDKAEVYIVPLLSGSGIRLKILEAMSRGKAIVSTGKGAEGIVCEHGRNIMIADTGEEFASAVIELLGDRKKRYEMGKAAFANVEAHYSWSGIIEQLMTCYEQCMSSRGHVDMEKAAG